MFTPQQLEQITFHTSVFGGYDMDSVDEFLVALIEDYNTLYKDNATLKSKMRVLVEKLEEYRAEEGGAKENLRAAQQTCDAMIREAEAKCLKMLHQAEAQAPNTSLAEAKTAARHLIFELAFHRYHIPVLANGDNGLPEILGIRRGRNHLLQGLPDFGALLAHMPANV